MAKQDSTKTSDQVGDASATAGTKPDKDAEVRNIHTLPRPARTPLMFLKSTVHNAKLSLLKRAEGQLGKHFANLLKRAEVMS